MREPVVLRRTLSVRDLIVYGLLFIGPLAPVGVFGVLDAKSGGAVALVYVIATIAMAFTAVSYAEMSRVVPEAGSVFAYASAGLGHRAGFLAGWLVMLDYLLIPSVAYLFSGIALHALFPAVPAWVFTGLAFVLTTALNLSGVRLAAGWASPFSSRRSWCWPCSWSWRWPCWSVRDRSDRGCRRSPESGGPP